MSQLRISKGNMAVIIESSSNNVAEGREGLSLVEKILITLLMKIDSFCCSPVTFDLESLSEPEN